MTKFVAGQSGNPEGRPKGVPNKRSQLAKLLEPHAEALVNKAIELAKAGDINALRLCLDRLLPKLKDEPICLDLPDGDLTQTESLLAAGVHVIEAVAEGHLSPEQGKTITTILENQRRSIETCELAHRVAEVERVLQQRSNKK